MVLDISGCLEVGVELLRIKGSERALSADVSPLCQDQLSLPSQWKQPFPGPVGLQKPTLIGSRILSLAPN